VKRFTIRTSGGQHISSMTSTRSFGSRTLRAARSSSPQRVILHSAVDLTIEAPGRQILVRAKAVDFEQASEAPHGEVVAEVRA
jgi:hypothetical protein